MWRSVVQCDDDRDSVLGRVDTAASSRGVVPSAAVATPSTSRSESSSRGGDRRRLAQTTPVRDAPAAADAASRSVLCELEACRRVCIARACKWQRLLSRLDGLVHGDVVHAPPLDVA
jgi:hypothetical protein